MTYAFTAKALIERIKNADALPQLLDEYRALLDTTRLQNPGLRTDLRRVHEELPDLQRLVTKGHDAILKGRLLDGLKTFLKVIEPAPAAAEEPAPEAPFSADDDTEKRPTEKPFRNKPTLRME